MITVATYEWPMLAELARTRLDACGIDATIADEYFGSIFWQYAKALGGLRVQVADEDAEDARAILSETALPAAEPVAAEVDEKAERFARAAVFGILAIPAALYALWLLFGLLAGRERLSARARRLVVLGVALIALCGVIPALAFAAFRFL